MKNGCPLFTALFIDGSGGNVTIVVCRAVGDGWLADRLPVWMGHKGCGSGAASLARPGCGFGKAVAFPKRGREVGQPAALPSANLRRLRRHRRATNGRRLIVQ